MARLFFSTTLTRLHNRRHWKLLTSTFCFLVLMLFSHPDLYAENWDVVVDSESTTSTPERPRLRPEEKLPTPEPLSSAERTTAKEILEAPGSNPDKRCEWYKEKIQRFSKDIRESAQKEGIPPKLLAAVVLNELADVGWDDVIQDQQLSATHGDYHEYETAVLRAALWWKSIAIQSFGIAQISPKTAIRYDAVYVPAKNLMTRKNELEFRIAYRLLNRRIAISAAARITKGIMKDIEKHQDSDWVKQFIRPGCRFSAEKPYDALYPKPARDGSLTESIRREREKRLAQLVTSVYNSGNILTPGPNRQVPNADDNESRDFPNALKHGVNARSIGEDLFDTKGCGMGLETETCEDLKGNYGIETDQLIVTQVDGTSNISVGQKQWMRPAGSFQVFQSDECGIVAEFRGSQIEGTVSEKLATLSNPIVGNLISGTLLKTKIDGKDKLKVVLKIKNPSTGAVITREGTLTKL